MVLSALSLGAMMKKRVYVFFGALLFFCANQIEAKVPFATLAQAAAYAKVMPELPPIDNNDLLHPLFKQFHLSLKKGAFARLKGVVVRALGITTQPAWTPRSCVTLLERMRDTRAQAGLQGDFVWQMTLRPQNRVVIWGDLQGAFHSFVRDLQELKRQGVLGDDLRIIKDGYYFAFNGDLIDRSAYSLETLSLALRLMEENPGRVFYLRGNHEEKGRWRDFGLKRELIDRLGHLSGEPVPFASLVDDIFNNLAIALYIRRESAKGLQVLRISHYGRDDPRIDEEKIGSWLAAGEKPYLLLKDLPKQKKRIVLPAIIKGQSRSTIYQETDGLTLLPPDMGSTAWTILSCPTQTYQKLYNFYNDAFCILNLGESISDSVLGLYTRDVRGAEGFTVRAVNVATGQTVPMEELEKPKTIARKDEIVFGCTLDLSKGLRVQGMNIIRGVSSRLNAENQRGGVDGKQLRFVVLDDGYTPHVARRNIELLMSVFNTDIILCPMGSPTVAASLDLVRNGKVFMLFPVTGAPLFRHPDLEYMLHFKTSFYNEAVALVRHAFDQHLSGRFLFLYQDDAFGKGALEGARAELKRRGITEWKEVPYRRNAVDFATQIQKISAYDPDAIFFFATSIAATAFIRQIGVQHLTDKMLFGISDMGEFAFKYFMKNKGLSMTIASIVPNPKESQLPIVQEYRKTMNQLGYPLDPFSLEGYIGASITVDLVQRCGCPITVKKLIETAKNTKNYSLKGLTLTYDPQTKELTKDIWLDTGEGDWLYRPVQHQQDVAQVRVDSGEKTAKIIAAPAQ